MASQKLSIYTIKINTNISWSQILENLLKENTEQERCIINEQTDSYIGGCYLLETIHIQTQYNDQENRFELVPTKRLNIMKFDVFIDNGSLMLWGGKRVATSFITAIEKAANQRITLEYKESDFKQMVYYLINCSDVIFTRMKITDIIIDNGIMANCSVNLKGQEDERTLVKKYIENISQISITIGKEETLVSVTIYSSGAVVVYKDRDDISDESMNIINEMLGGVI